MMGLRRKSHAAPRLIQRFTDAGLEYGIADQAIAPYLAQPSQLSPESQAQEAYLAQLEGEGFACRLEHGRLHLAWLDLYRLRNHPEHISSLPLLGLPAPCELRPALTSRGALSDPDFRIVLDGWRNPTGQTVRAAVQRTGAVIQIAQESLLLPEAGWRLLEAVRGFARLPDSEKAPARNFREWGRIRALGLHAGAVLDDFLTKTVVLTPETLQLRLRRVEEAGAAGVEVEPTFTDAPENWLTKLDAGQAVLARYDLNAPGGGIVHVVIDPAVRRVLEQIKRMPRRRVVGAQAAAFLHNPFAYLGEEAAVVISPDAFEAARAEAGLAFPENWAQPRPLITTEAVFDLTGYAPRVEGIGAGKPVYSPYIVRAGEQKAWLPDTVEVGIAYTPTRGGQTWLLPFSKADMKAFGEALAQAETSGAPEFIWPGLPSPISLLEAKSIQADVELALKEVGSGEWKNETALPEPAEKDHPPSPAPLTLLIAHNIEVVDYAERRREALTASRATVPKPATLLADLLEHQKVGVDWLHHLWQHAPDYARGGLLADDMGLGKTLQLLTFLAHLFADKPGLSPVLVVAPVALLDNWQQEIKRFFTPGTFRVLTLYDRELRARRVAQQDIDAQLRQGGLTRFLLPDWLGEGQHRAQLVLTTYETLRDYEFSLARESWSVMICDEAQKIKSPAALVTQAAKAMHARFKIAATGTPVENSLTDLWCLFDFIQPGLLGALNEFGRKYKRPIEAKTEKEKAALEELQRLFAPQILRRTKDEVVKLPAKTEDKGCRTLTMSSPQRTLYAQALTAYRTRIAACDSKKIGQAMLGMLHHLRLLCAHPTPMGQVADISPSLDEARKASPKLHWLLDTLEHIRSKEEKAIVFTELRDIQRVLQHYIGAHFGERPVIVNGDTDTRPDQAASRQRLIDAFQARPGFGVILLSTQAVGFGLNIQKANHVIHYTRPWNPAKEDQATDRAYRIGQDKAVTVYYPTVHALDFVTFEKRLDELLGSKRELAAKTWLNGADEIQVAEFGNLQAEEGLAVFQTGSVGETELRNIEGHALEDLCTLLWKKLGFQARKTPKSGDGGVDVVALKDQEGVLIQCKATSQAGHEMGWEAVKDVSAGARAYMAQYPGIHFKRVAVTNQAFNASARKQAGHNKVELIERDGLLELLTQHPIELLEFHLAVG